MSPYWIGVLIVIGIAATAIFTYMIPAMSRVGQ